ncbi:hypothetical protein PtrSN002B_003176 [Pyrenophora tritici-repentis]|nr:hypothetical protein PtrV1_05628 [Pyrenophora tritici-repentis]KAI0578323.1 hypothetical protein Alg130_07999 [Pyrenophora tritici-repentis]KAI0581552.1 hypothetical protein Alg215_04650 [Pyrenophora tritici-repentis]KAI0607762.1 hypothetical protein TUN205_08001 [Pyrenophora tritici-repentis]KAI0620026.1 hypothetical protein TUN199_07992 [Pyrenophora tritici-repentis]
MTLSPIYDAPESRHIATPALHQHWQVSDPDLTRGVVTPSALVPDTDRARRILAFLADPICSASGLASKDVYPGNYTAHILPAAEAGIREKKDTIRPW